MINNDVSTEVESHDDAKETDDQKDEQALSDHENNTQSKEESPVTPQYSECTWLNIQTFMECTHV